MNQILLLGAGRSASTLISYLLSESDLNNWKLTVADQSLLIANEKINRHPNGKAVQLEVTDDKARAGLIARHNLIISLLPPHLHDLVAADCLRLGKNLVTASYVSKAQEAMDKEVRKQGLLFLCEMGLDPGIDHMSAMEMISTFEKEGAEILSFKSATGGLVSPENDDNPWHYKITWNPRNVVLAGQATAQYLENGKVKYLPYNRIFTTTEKVNVKGIGKFEAYANRDSLSYIDKYGLQKVPTVIRQTLRADGYCKAWNLLVQLGMTDDSFTLNQTDNMTYRNFTESFLPSGKLPAEKKIIDLLKLKNKKKSLDKLKWLGLFDKEMIGIHNATPAQVIQQLLERKLKMQDDDKDMIIIRHEFVVKRKQKKYLHEAVFVMKGENQIHTAMANTVGLPLGIAAKNILNGKIKTKGVQIPVHSEIYKPVLKELQHYGVIFHENEKQILR